MKTQWIVVANAALSDAVARRLQLTADSDYTGLGLSELDQRLHDMHMKT